MLSNTTWERKKAAEKIFDSFETAWRQGSIPQLRDWLRANPDLYDLLGPQLLEIDTRYRRQRGESPCPADYSDLPPEWFEPGVRLEDKHAGEAVCSGSAPTHRLRKTDPTLPREIGGFEILDRLGHGRFGEVYLAHDSSLDRLVAIKVPRDRERRRLDIEWIREARIIAMLDHPHIVPVYHVGTSPGFPIFIVTKYIDGCSLAERIRQAPPTLAESVDLIINVADALDYAHRTEVGVIHRDIKPSNLLLDSSDRIYVADFGLAERETDLRLNRSVEGTPCYMSPEQARGEGHRVDGRSDLFSLGIVLYELLAGHRPFAGKNTADVLEQIKHAEAPPLRVGNSLIPVELERICRKALSKRSAERYDTVGEFAADLRQLRDSGALQPSIRRRQPVDESAVESSRQAGSSTAESGKTAGMSPGEPLALGAKGLRAFDSEDAELFLELLPGQRDREGVPESIRFWKQRIEQTDPLRTFSVGVLTGSSGCGKSSLVKAGLLPRISDQVITIYLEASADLTESDLLQRLRHRIPRLKEDRDLASCLTAVRRQSAGLGRRKLLLVIDQFEQWLQAHQWEPNSALAEALRQCDGQHLQCLLMVRDDYAMGVFRFLRQLETALVQGQNSAVVDRFDLPHAARVLTSFGRAMGKLSATAVPLEPGQQSFIDQAIASLAEQNQVVPVRLALFAEMFRNRPWTTESLISVGGAEGVGRTFLEETFGSDAALPHYRAHARGAQQVLAALLPEAGSDIKGHSRTYESLVMAAGYAVRPQDAVELFRILDSELRLISPVETENAEQAKARTVSQGKATDTQGKHRNYHLTHDYLVPSLRAWMEEIAGSTPVGRAKLLLRDRSRLWNARPFNRYLPSLREHMQIRRWITPAERSEQEQRMLKKAAAVHGRWGALVLLGLLLLTLGGEWMRQDRRQRAALAQVDRLESAEAGEWRRAFESLRNEGLDDLGEIPLRERLRTALAGGESVRAVKMRAGLLATRDDRSQVEPLGRALFEIPLAEFAEVRELLKRTATPGLTSQFWERLLDDEPGEAGQTQKLRAGAALAAFAPDDPQWISAAPTVVDCLLSLSVTELVAWRPLFEPIRKHLAPTIAAVIPRTKPQKFDAVCGLAEIDQPTVTGLLEQKLRETQPDNLSDRDLGQRNLELARASAALVRLGEADRVWPFLVFDPEPQNASSQDPSLRTEIVHAMAECGVAHQVLVDRLESGGSNAQNGVRDPREESIKRALLVALGDYTGVLTARRKSELVKRLQFQRVFSDNPDPGIHSTCEWLLRHWGESEWVNNKRREMTDARRHANPTTLPRALKEGESRTWFVNSQDQTFVVFPPGVMRMGAPKEERERNSSNEVQHQRQIEHSFAIAATEITRRQFAVFTEATHTQQQKTPLSTSLDDPQTCISWLKGAQYCNWLSRQEKLDPCYRIEGAGNAMTVSMEPDFLKRNGYRMPTEAEWEYACRAGVCVDFPHGRSVARLPQSAWFLPNSEAHFWPVGSLLPNEAGLFDTSGNAVEWCQERFLDYPIADHVHPMFLDRETTVDMKSGRVLRSGSNMFPARDVRIAFRIHYLPTDGGLNVSFRPARTLP
ncbi:MAG: protein kinase domain-containing protein [Planctomycetaceae bacterium]